MVEDVLQSRVEAPVAAASKDIDPLRALSVDLGASRRATWLRILAILFIKGGNRKIIVLIRLMQWLHIRGRKHLSRWLEGRIARRYSCYIQPSASIGPGLKLPHPTGIVIGSGVRIGARAIIYHQVTLGGARRGDWKADRYPDVGSDVTIFAGAKVIGAITIGDGAQVGANAVVNCDVPSRHVAVGVPARCRPLASALRNSDHR